MPRKPIAAAAMLLLLAAAPMALGQAQRCAGQRWYAIAGLERAAAARRKKAEAARRAEEAGNKTEEARRAEEARQQAETEARRQAESLAFERARDSDELAGWQAYLDAFPEGSVGPRRISG